MVVKVGSGPMRVDVTIVTVGSKTVRVDVSETVRVDATILTVCSEIVSAGTTISIVFGALEVCRGCALVMQGVLQGGHSYPSAGNHRPVEIPRLSSTQLLTPQKYYLHQLFFMLTLERSWLPSPPTLQYFSKPISAKSSRPNARMDVSKQGTQS